MKRVMLVAYHNTFRECLALMLEWHTDFKECVQVQSLAEAGQILDSLGDHLDLAIVNLDFAPGGGFDLINVLRMTHPDVPVLAITREQDAYSRDQALRAGAEEVLTMTASLKEVVDGAKRLVGE